MEFDLNHTCFLCGRTAETTEEHVFPRWLQRRFDLWDQFVVLLNGTRIRYRDLRIPCCTECNNEHLSQVESKVSTLCSDGDADRLNAESDTLFIWLYKLMYGINYKELFLSNDRKDPNARKIVSQESHSPRGSYKLFLKFARGGLKSVEFSPYSVFVFRIQDSSPTTYYFASEPYKLVASAIIGNVGIVASFQDDGYISKDISRYGVLDGRKTLSLAEFGDFSAFVMHLKTRMKMPPNYLVAKYRDRIELRVQPWAETERYREFNVNTQREITQKMFGFCFQSLVQVNDNGVAEIKYRSPFVYF